MKKACFSIHKTHAFNGRKWWKLVCFVKILYFYLIIHHPKHLSLHCKRFQMSSARSVKKIAFLGNFPIFSSIYLSKKCFSTCFRSCQELAKNEKNSQAAACEFSLVIRLGLEPKTPTLKVLCSTNWASGSPLFAFDAVFLEGNYFAKSGAKVLSFFHSAKFLGNFLLDCIHLPRFFEQHRLLSPISAPSGFRKKEENLIFLLPCPRFFVTLPVVELTFVRKWKKNLISFWISLTYS